MKPTLASLLLVSWCGVILGSPSNQGHAPGRPAPLLEELVQMTEAGSSAGAVLAYARAHRLELPPQVSDEDLRWLRDSGVSGRVVAYMAAFDVRAADEGSQREAGSGSHENAARPQEMDSYPEAEDGGYGRRGPDGRAQTYPDHYADDYAADNYADNYADNHDVYAGGYGYYPDYGYGYYPDYGYGYGYGYDYDPYPYPFFFADQRAFFRGFHGRGHRFRGHHRFDGGFRRHRGAVGRFASRDAWRDRGFRGGRGGPTVVRPRGSARPAFARGFGGPRASGGRPIGRRTFGPPGSARGSFPNAFRGPQRSFGGPGGFGRHGGFGRPGSSSGGARVAGGSAGGRGRR